MSRKSPGTAYALLLLLSVAVCPAKALAEPDQTCSPEALQSIFYIWGDTPHWAVILLGIGTCRDGRIETAKAIPYLVWTAGAERPEQVDVTFAVENMTCIAGSMGVPTVVRVADCKLVYPGEGLLVASRPEQLVRAITKDGKFVVTWKGQTEQVTWRYAYPPVRNDNPEVRDSHNR